MSALNPRVESFVSLLLEVSGRARPSDIQGVSAGEADGLLREYAAKYNDGRLRFEGDTLVQSATAAPAAPSAVAETAPAVDAFAPAPGAAIPEVIPAGGASQVPDQELPAWMIEGTPQGMQAAGIPSHEAGMFETGVEAPRADVSPFEFSETEQPATLSTPLTDDFLELPPLEEAEGGGRAKKSRKGPSPLLIVLLVVLVLVAAAAAVVFTGLVQIPGLSF